MKNDKTAKTGDKIKLHYIGKIDSGEIFDNSYEKYPLLFTIGAGSVISGFENEVIGMKEGEKKKFYIPYERAYGPIIQELIFEIDKNLFPKTIEIQLGKELEFKQKDGKILYAKIIKINEKTVTVNANHPLAGKNLSFEIELIKIL